MPTNFDATYCYALGFVAGALLQCGQTGLIASVRISPQNNRRDNASSFSVLWHLSGSFWEKMAFSRGPYFDDDDNDDDDD